MRSNLCCGNIHLGAKLEGIYRKDIYELPPDSIRELIINAVMIAVICKIRIFRLPFMMIGWKSPPLAVLCPA